MTRIPRLPLAAAAAFAAVGFGVLGSGTAHADQQDILVARDDLNQALNAMQQAGSDWGGHKAQAAELVRQAIDQINQGIQFVDSHPPQSTAPAAGVAPQQGIPGIPGF
jgi:uncharacterized phage infection (PIP) family protein YhgE